MLKSALVSFQFIFIFLLSGWVPSALAAGSCQIYLSGHKSSVRTDSLNFNQTHNSKTSPLELLMRIDTALDRIEAKETRSVTKEELKKLKSPSKIMTILKKNYQSSIALSNLVWMSLEQRIFTNDDVITSDFVNNKAQPVFDRYNEHFNKLKLSQTYKSALKGNVQARQKLAQSLRELELVAEVFLEKPVDLFSEQGWKTLFSLNDIKELSQRIKDIFQKFKHINHQVSKVRINLEQPDGIAVHYENHFFGEGRRRAQNDIKDTKSRISIAETKTLIQSLGLDRSKEEYYLKIADVLNQPVSNQSLRIKVAAILNLYQAYLEKFSEIPGLTDKNLDERLISMSQYFQVKQKILQNKIVSAFLNIQFENYLNEAEGINERITILKDKLYDISHKYSLPSDKINEIEEKIYAIKKIDDFSQNLDRIETELRPLEVKLDGLKELGLKKVRNENIRDFSELNFRWQRLIANKAYNLKGVDYNQVIFTKDVVDFFKDHPVDGARFLSALSKSYVAVKKASGLRRLPSLHSDFRDIKVINNSFGKIRVVGRLVDGKIYFFHVYVSEKAYENTRMQTLIENFQP